MGVELVVHPEIMSVKFVKQVFCFLNNSQTSELQASRQGFRSILPQDIASKMECNKGISAISHDAGRSSARSAAERARRAVAVRTAVAAAAGERARTSAAYRRRRPTSGRRPAAERACRAVAVRTAAAAAAGERARTAAACRRRRRAFSCFSF